MKFKNLVMEILTSGKYLSDKKQESENSQEHGLSDYIIRYILMNFIHIFGSIVLLLFALQNMQKESYFDAIACLFMAIIAIIGFTISRTKVPQIVPAIISMISFGFFCILLIWNGDANGAGFLFIFIYPMLTVILLDMIKGIIFSAAMLVIVSVQFLVPGISRFEYHIDISLRMIAVFILVTGITIVFENNRKTKDKINERLTLKIKGINENLQKIVEERTNNLLKLRDTFGRYLPDMVIKKIMDSPSGPSLGGEKKYVTVLITDIRGFTTLSEKYESEIIVNMLNYYFTNMVNVIHSFNGTLIEFIGDSILAVFGAPLNDELHIDHAVACALKMQIEMAEINKWNENNKYPLIEMGIGINSGEVIVGNIGSDKAMKYNIIGNHVNLASRIESYTAGGQVFVSNTTLENLQAVPKVINTMEITPKGYSKTIQIHQIIALGEPYNIFYEDKNQHP